MSRYYTLKPDHSVEPCDLHQWSEEFEDPSKRVVASDHWPTPNADGSNPEDKGVHVSTIFLGLDHSFQPDGPPVLFETMIFGGQHDQYQERYTTYELALLGHAKAVAFAKEPYPIEGLS
jgi:hypothetical protein